VAFAAGEAEVPEGDALRSESERVGSATSAPTTATRVRPPLTDRELLERSIPNLRGAGEPAAVPRTHRNAPT
jgi:hypothetical protein